MCNVAEKLESLKQLQHELKEYRKSLNEELSTIDKEIVDIEHYMEFYNFNAAQGYNAYKMLKDKFMRRREIKNELEKLNLIWNNKLCHFTTNVEQQLKKVDNKKYKARILKELFS